MSAQPLKNLGLPPVPLELKPILGFMQRADELKSQEPIVAYWALYHAAQVGISTRVKEPDSRSYLPRLLTVLEDTKKEIGPIDTIDNEAVASAYVENFALKIFGMVDSEDRAGKATRGTAKKFLVAANLLELLEVFKANASDPVVASDVDDKIRYAKWKAADIAKAFREGRKPTPGPAGQEGLDSPVPNITIEAASPQQSIPPGFAGVWPVPPSQFDPGPTSPENWSTVATPGTAGDRAFDLPISPRGAMVSEELEGLPPPPEEPSFGDPHTGRPTEFSPEPAPPQPPLQPDTGTFTTPSIETIINTPSQPPIQSYQQNFQPTPPAPIPARVISSPPTAPVPAPQLTPKQISQAQKHCRYAISALDYEDFERAKKDLLDALSIIGG